MVTQLEGNIISNKADIWALGCLLYKMIYYKTPFDENQIKIIDGTFDFPPIPTYPDNVKDLISNYKLK